MDFLLESCENKLLMIRHNICANFDQNTTLEENTNFLDISKAFEKVLHEVLLFTPERIDVSGNVLSLLKCF